MEKACQLELFHYRNWNWSHHKWLQRFIFHFHTSAFKHNLQKFDEAITFQIIFIIYKVSRKTQFNQRNLHNLQSYLASWLEIQSVKIWWRYYVLLETDAAHFCGIFLDIGHCFRSAQKQSGKSDNVRIISNKKNVFLVNIPSLYLSWYRM